jgi:hypothetical protein
MQMLRSLKRTTTPAPPVGLTEAKTAARIDGNDQDAWISQLLTAATESAEHDTDRSLCTGAWLLTLPSWVMTMEDLGRPPLQTLPAWPLYIASWPLAPYLELPRPPLVSVASVKYYDSNGVDRTLATTQYTVDTAPRRGRICLLPNVIWPITARRWDAVRITFTAGYATAAAVPAGIKVGIIKLVSYWYHNPTAAGDVPPEISRIFERQAVHTRGY